LGLCEAHAAVVMFLLRHDSSAECARLTATDEGEGVPCDGDMGDAAERERRVGAGDDISCKDMCLVLMGELFKTRSLDQVDKLHLSANC